MLLFCLVSFVVWFEVVGCFFEDENVLMLSANCEMWTVGGGFGKFAA